MNEHYVYVHLIPSTKQVFYIGIGQKHRVIEGGRLRNKEWQRVVYDNGGFLFEFLHKDISKGEALILEREYILKYGIDNLTNIVGENGNSTAFVKGGVPWNKGLKNSQAPSSKAVIVNGIEYCSVNVCIKRLGIGNTTFYRRIKSGKIHVKYV